MELEAKTLDSVELLIRDGKIDAARDALRTFVDRHCPRKYVATISCMLRRTGLVDMSLSLLKPWRGEFKPAEAAEFAAGLNVIGAYDEAQILLESLNVADYPKILLYQSFLLFRGWKYNESIPKLEAFLKTERDPYNLIVGRINLLAALIVEEMYDLADECAQKLKTLLDGTSYETLKTNLAELQVQRYTSSGEFEKAREWLTPTNLNSSRSQFLIEKRAFFLECVTSPSRISDTTYESFRRRAWDANDFDSIRDTDFYQGNCQNDIRRLSRVYYGTPFSHYRDMVLSAAIGPEVKKIGEFVFTHPLDKVNPPHLLDLGSGDITGAEGLAVGQAMHKLMGLFCRDLYRPLKIGQIFRLLYPGEFYDVDSSPGRVKNVLFRLREFSKTQKLGFEILEKDRGFKLYLGNKFGVKIPDQSLFEVLQDRQLFLISSLRQKFSGSDFTKAQAMEILNLSSTQAWKVLRGGVDQGLLVNLRQGNKQIYRFKA